MKSKTRVLGCLLIAILVAAPFARADGGSPARIREVRIGSHDDYDRLVIELDSDADVAWENGPEAGEESFYIAAAPAQPSRVFVTKLPRMGTVSVTQMKGGTHIAVEPRERRVRAYTLSNPPRLVVDFAEPGTTPFGVPEGARALEAARTIGPLVQPPENAPAPTTAEAPPVEPAPAPKAAPVPRTAPVPKPEPVAKAPLPPVEPLPEIEPTPEAEPEPNEQAKAEPSVPEPTVVAESPSADAPSAATPSAEAPSAEAPKAEPAQPAQPQPAATEKPAPTPKPKARPATNTAKAATDSPFPWELALAALFGLFVVIAAITYVVRRRSAASEPPIVIFPDDEGDFAAAELAEDDLPEAVPADDILPAEILAASDREAALEKRVDEEVRARVELEQRFAGANEELKVLRDRLHRLEQRRREGSV